MFLKNEQVRSLSRMDLGQKDIELSSSLSAMLDSIVEEEKRNNKIPGLCAAVVRDQEIIWSKAAGHSDLETRSDVSLDTIFAVGSLTKLVTAAMLMQLRDAGRINLDDPVEKYLPSIGIHANEKRGRSVTIRQIASHTAGIPREVSFESWNTLNFPPSEKLLEELMDLTPVFPPLSRYKYSNLGYAILGQVLSLAAGVPYKQYVQDKILKPLGMDSSGFEISGLPSQPATGYTVYGDEPIEKTPYVNFEAMVPAGQLFSSVRDMSRFVSMQFIDEPSVLAADRAAVVLDPATIREMHTPVYVGKRWAGGTGIGWHISRAFGDTVSSHRGGIPGFTTDVALIREIKLGVVVFTNAFPQPNEIAVRILELLAPVIGKIAEKENEIRTEQTWPEIFDIYLGRYRSRYYGEIEVKVANGRLVITDPLALPGLEIVLIPAGKHRFIMSGGDEDGEFAIFDVAADGSVKSINTAGYLYDIVRRP